MLYLYLLKLFQFQNVFVTSSVVVTSSVIVTTSVVATVPPRILDVSIGATVYWIPPTVPPWIDPDTESNVQASLIDSISTGELPSTTDQFCDPGESDVQSIFLHGSKPY